MIAMFNSVKEFAVFNSKPHTFHYGKPYQMGANSANLPVYVKLVSGSESMFKRRVEQFNGLVM
jgi:hypothetical protein